MSIPHVKLIVNAAGRGTFTVNGVELQVERVTIDAIAQGGTRVKFEMLAHIECEIAPDGFATIHLKDRSA
jgi:hypothetical protein